MRFSPPHPHTFLLFFFTISIPVTVAQAVGTLELFGNAECDPNAAGAFDTTIDLALNVCLDTKGVIGLAIQNVPSCNVGTATLIRYNYAACAVPATFQTYDGCLYYSPLLSFAAIMFACSTANALPTSTSTVSLGATYPVGTEASSAITQATTTTPPAGPATTAASPTNSVSSVVTSTTSLNSSQPVVSVATDSSSSGLSESDKIALGVGIGGAVGTIIVAILAWQCPRARPWNWRRYS
jgi:hypothetical protein